MPISLNTSSSGTKIGSVYTRIPKDIFVGSTYIIARKNRDDFFADNPDDLMHFKQDSRLSIVIKKTGVDAGKIETYYNGMWNISPGYQK